MERWRPTEWRAYEISDQGRVRSRNRVVRGKNGSSRFIKGRVLVPSLRHGHPCVNLWRGNHCTRVRIDRLLEQAFGYRPTPRRGLAQVLRR